MVNFWGLLVFVGISKIMSNYANWFELKGQVIKTFDIGDVSIGIELENGQKYSLYHEQDCCEYVRLIKSEGNIENIIGSEVTLAEEDSSEPDGYNEKYDDSHTWSKFTLKTVKGQFTAWFLGESNGYYNESMTFKKDK